MFYLIIFSRAPAARCTWWLRNSLGRADGSLAATAFGARSTSILALVFVTDLKNKNIFISGTAEMNNSRYRSPGSPAYAGEFPWSLLKIVRKSEYICSHIRFILFFLYIAVQCTSMLTPPCLYSLTTFVWWEHTDRWLWGTYPRALYMTTDQIQVSSCQLSMQKNTASE